MEKEIYKEAVKHYKESLSGKAVKIKNPALLERLSVQYAEFVLSVFNRKKRNREYFQEKH